MASHTAPAAVSDQILAGRFHASISRFIRYGAIRQRGSRLYLRSASGFAWITPQFRIRHDCCIYAKVYTGYTGTAYVCFGRAASPEYGRSTIGVGMPILIPSCFVGSNVPRRQARTQMSIVTSTQCLALGVLTAGSLKGLAISYTSNSVVVRYPSPFRTPGGTRAKTPRIRCLHRPQVMHPLRYVVLGIVSNVSVRQYISV